LEEAAWRPALDQDGQARDGAWVAELTGTVCLDGWPAGSRLICRRERPHPGAQLTFTDLDGHRFQCFITDQPGADSAALEVRHRQHAEVEDRVKTLKQTGASFLPFHAFQPNAAWFELALCAHDTIIWTQLLCLDAPDLRAQTAALPHPARRRPAHPPRPPPHAAPPRRLALGPRDSGRLRAARRATCPRLTARRRTPRRRARGRQPRPLPANSHNRPPTRAPHASPPSQPLSPHTPAPPSHPRTLDPPDSNGY
jgi:DDE family transposase